LLLICCHETTEHKQLSPPVTILFLLQLQHAYWGAQIHACSKNFTGVFLTLKSILKYTKMYTGKMYHINKIYDRREYIHATMYLSKCAKVESRP
jgi:hypothetical protein